MKRKNWIKRTVGIMVCIVLILNLSTNMVCAEGVTSDNESVAQQVVSDMGAGWNLGNTLDSYNIGTDAYKVAQQMMNKYQMMATYSTKYYSGWDASAAPYFSVSNSECTLTWNISKMNSAVNQACGKFAFQLINHSIKDTGTDLVDFTVSKAQFTNVKGTTYVLSDMLGTYSKAIKSDVTTYVTADLTKIPQLATSADILGGTLTITVKINKYPLPKVSTISKDTFYETLWGNPVTTKAMIDMVKAAGFGAVRIPVTYYNHMDEQGNIDQAWLARVATIVQYVLDNNMYCIINMHHDTGENGWLRADLDTLDATGIKFTYAWQQIAGYFKNYNQKLLFEGYNELLNNENQWSFAGKDSYTAANQLNQMFVDTVRSTGSNNTERCLIVNTYASSTEADVLAGFALPNDSVANRLVIETHYYGSTLNGIDAVLKRLNNMFVSQGVPVIIGECGTSWKMAESERIKYASYLTSTARKYDISCFWWDDGNYANKAGSKCDYAILDRSAMIWYYPAIANAFVNGSR